MKGGWGRTRRWRSIRERRETGGGEEDESDGDELCFEAKQKAEMSETVWLIPHLYPPTLKSDVMAEL